MKRLFLLVLIAPALALQPTVRAQSVNVTFRYLPEGVVENAFVPGSFNTWGQPYNASGCIAPGSDAAMEYVSREPYPAVGGMSQTAGYWRKQVPLQAGERFEYKVQVHRNISATSCDWLSDPLNPETAGANNNSVLVVADPMVFQLGPELSGDGLVRFMSASLVSSSPVATIRFTINGIERDDGMTFYNEATGIFRYQLDRDVRIGSQLKLEVTDDAGRMFSDEIGEIQPPIAWITEAHRSVEASVVLRAFLTSLDGSVDPSLTGATIVRDSGGSTFVPVSNGLAEVTQSLNPGENTFWLRAEIDGQAFESAPLVVTRWTHPLEAPEFEAAVTGSAFNWTVSLAEPASPPASYEVSWTLDEILSTTEVDGFTASGLVATGTAVQPGEVYIDVEVSSAGEVIDRLRAAVLIGSDGAARAMAFAENAAWTKQAVVYEIFPLMFGPTATGTITSPGRRLQQITDELDYIADMGFNTIWFMPIMANRTGMTAVGAGYNIVDFKRVDQRLGTAEDFRALVTRAHELGIRIVLDLTPSHVSPDHPWVSSLRASGAFSDYIQTTPSQHNRGQDGRGANLPEIWQVDGGVNLYRKYDGFGDLANLNWDNDNLQAEMLDVIAWWINEFDIDGYRMDVWWGPTRRYGVERFGRPVREIVKRIRPDAWLLGEITGTGSSTEVYYADDDNGTSVVGGLDAAYDWSLYHSGIRGSYGNVSTYDFYARNNNFYPGPNARYFRFLENHDEPRLAYLYRSNPDRMKPLAGYLLTITGIPMVYAGQEVGFGSIDDYAQRFPVDWELEGNGQLARLYQQLAHVRQQFPAFGTQAMEPVTVSRSGQPKTYVFTRPYLDQNAVVAINFEAAPVSLTIDPSDSILMSTDGPVPYYDVFADTARAYLGEFNITLPPYSTTVYITSDSPGFVLPDLPSLPYGAVYTGVEMAELPASMRLLGAYPNPFNPQTRIVFEVPGASQVVLEVFDVLGRRVRLLHSGVLAAGRHETVFDGAGLPSGTYLYRLRAGDAVQTKTMVLVK